MPIVPPFIWADTLAFSAGGSSGQTISVDTITVPPGLLFTATPILLLYFNTGLTALTESTNPEFSFRFPDATAAPIDNHFGGVPHALSYESANGRFAEGGVIVCNATLRSSGTSTNLLAAALVDMSGIRDQDFAASGNFASRVPTVGSESPNLTSTTVSVKSFSTVSVGEPFAHVAISRLAVQGFAILDGNANTGPRNLTSAPTWQVGNIGTWTDIIVATASDRQVGFGLYAASATGQSRLYMVTNLTPGGINQFSPFGNFTDVTTISQVFLPATTGRSFATVIG